MTEILLSQVQAAEMGFDKVRSCGICRALNVELLLRIYRSQLCWFGHVSRMPHERLARQVVMAKTTEKRPRPPGPEVVQGPGGVMTSPALLGPLLVWSQDTVLGARIILVPSIVTGILTKEGFSSFFLKEHTSEVWKQQKTLYGCYCEVIVPCHRTTMWPTY